MSSGNQTQDTNVIPEPGTYEIEARVRVRITVTDSEQIRRCVDNIDGWRDHLYQLETPADVFQHLAFNCIANGVERANRLDGWADLEHDRLTMEVSRDIEFEDQWTPSTGWVPFLKIEVGGRDS